MSSLAQQFKERRIWGVLIAYPSMTFVLLQVIEFFINNYGWDARLLTATIVAAVVLLPAAFIWNWRHGESGTQDFVRSEWLAYGVSLATAALAVMLYWQQSPRPEIRPISAAQSPESTDVRSIAVLPFTNNSGDSGAQYLSDGIAESLINWLAAEPGLRVASKSASFRLRELADDTQAVATRLKVDSVLRGSLDRVGEQMVVSVSWVDARHESQLWGQRLIKPDNDILALEQEIVSAIQVGIGSNVGQSNGEQVVSGGTSDTQAHEHYLRGHFLIQSTNPDEIYDGVDELRKAIAADPGFARPYADIADALSQLVSYGWSDDDQLIGEARTAAFTAVALAPELAEAHTAMGLMHSLFFDWAAADAAFEQATQLKPTSPVPYHRYADFLMLMLQFEKSQEMARRALALDPLDSSSMHAVGLSHMLAGQFEESSKILADWVRFYPQSQWAKIKYALSLSLGGRCKESNDVLSVFGPERRANMSTLMTSWLIWNYHLCDRPEDFEQGKQHILANTGDQQQAVDPGLVYLNALIGETEQLTQLLEQVYEQQSPFRAFTQVFMLDYLGLRFEPPIEHYPPYQALLAKIDFPESDYLSTSTP